MNQMRRHWTARSMYEQEFAAIWNKQHAFQPDTLTPELREEIGRLLFFQRPAPSQSHLLGACELKASHRRAPLASLEVQRFRILEKVNELRLQMATNGIDRPLSRQERSQLFSLLNWNDYKAFAQLNPI